MNKDIFLKHLKQIRIMIKAAHDMNEKDYIYVTESFLKEDCYDMLTFGALLESDNFPASTDMSDDELFSAFLIWKEGYGRGMYASATYLKDFIDEIRLPERLMSQCITAAFMEYGLRRLIPETKRLYGQLAYIAAFKDESKLVSGFNIKKSELEDMCGSTGIRFKTAFNDLIETKYIVVKNNPKRKNVFKIFVKITDEYVQNMGEYDLWFPDDAEEPWVVIGEWESEKSKNKKIADFKNTYGFDPLIHTLVVPDRVKEMVSEIIIGEKQ